MKIQYTHIFKEVIDTSSNLMIRHIHKFEIRIFLIFNYKEVNVPLNIRENIHSIWYVSISKKGTEVLLAQTESGVPCAWETWTTHFSG